MNYLQFTLCKENRPFIAGTKYLCILKASYPRSSFPSSPASLQGLCPGAAACYRNSMAWALMALLVQLQILQENGTSGDLYKVCVPIDVTVAYLT